MRKAYLLSLSMIALLAQPQAARAEAENNVNGTYAFSLQTTLTDPSKLCGGAASCGGVNNVAGSLGQFYSQFAADLKKGKCKSASSQLIALASKIASAGPKMGDTFYAVGTLVADGTGKFTDGQAIFNSSSVNGESINFLGTGTQAVVCGGTDASGLCASLCTTKSLNCAGNGGYTVSGRSGSARIYVYPQLAPGQCSPSPGVPVTTADQCCNDPSLVLIIHLSAILENLSSSTPPVAQKLDGVITDQGEAGLLEATF